MDYRAEIVKLYNSEAYHSLSGYYGRQSMLDIIGMARREDVHSNFLAWIFNGRGTGCGNYAVKKLLQAIVMAKSDFAINASAPLPEALMDVFAIGGYDVRNVSVDTERVIPGAGDRKSRRIDILLEIDVAIEDRVKTLPVIIENKVKSHEHTHQTIAYREWALETYVDAERYYAPVCVFLTPDKTSDIREGRGSQCECSEYVRLNYQYLVDYVFEPLRMRTTDQVTRTRVEDYLRCLSYANVTNEDGVKGELVMAITSKERELLRQFWKSNKALLSAAMEALSEDEDCTEEERQAFRSASETTSSKDYSRYRLQGEAESFGKRGIVDAVLRKYFGEARTLEQLSRDFPATLHTGGFSRLAAEITPEQSCRYFAPIQLADGNRVVCSNQWGAGNIEPFLDRARELGFVIERC